MTITMAVARFITAAARFPAYYGGSRYGYGGYGSGGSYYQGW